MAVGFDTIIAIDWSAAATPTRGANSIWIATSNGDLENPPTRLTAEALLLDLLATESGRLLVAIDVGLGYPTGTAAALGLSVDGQGAWWATWEVITSLSIDDEHNRNNRFEVAADLNRRIATRGDGEVPAAAAGPFWGRPPSFVSRWLAATKPSSFGPLSEFRLTELELRAAGHAPKSPWQLLGAGSVGSQTLTAVPMLHRLVTSDERVSVWPFMEPRQIVVAEVWPSLYLRPSQVPVGTVADAAQVRAVVDACRCGVDLTAPPVDPEVVSEEGWVLTP